MQKLLDAAMEAFDQRGYHATRVNDVVEIAQTSHGTFYLYFSNKEDLLEALVAQAAGDAASVYAALTAEPHTGTASWEELRVWINGYSELWRRYAPLFRGWTELAATERGVRTRVLRIVSSLTSAMASQIAASGAQAGMDPRVAGMAVLAMLDRFHYMREFFGEPIDEAAIDTLTTMVHRALFDSGLGAAR